jgi:hypothetical protein
LYLHPILVRGEKSPLNPPLKSTAKKYLMARPNKNGNDKREFTIRVRVTSTEKLRIWELAADAGFTPSDFMRAKTIGGAPTRRTPSPDRTVLLNFLAELGKIGSNVNQIARALNRRTEHGELVGIHPEDITHAMAGVDLLTTHLTRLLEDGHSR